MDCHRKRHYILWVIFMTLLGVFITTVISICTPRWCNVYPEHTGDMGYFGLLKNCGGKQEICYEREKILKFDVGKWPFGEMKHRDFDTILILLMLSMILVFVALVLTMSICCNYQTKWCERMLAVVTAGSAIVSISGLSYFENKVKKENKDGEVEHGWSSYLAWISTLILTALIVPVLYLFYLPTTDRTEYTRTGSENHYELTTTKNCNRGDF